MQTEVGYVRGDLTARFIEEFHRGDELKPDRPASFFVHRSNFRGPVAVMVTQIARARAVESIFAGEEDLSIAGSLAERLDQGFFFLLGELRQRVEGGEVSGKRGGR